MGSARTGSPDIGWGGEASVSGTIGCDVAEWAAALKTKAVLLGVLHYFCG
jgi:hypothetical protein